MRGHCIGVEQETSWSRRVDRPNPAMVTNNGSTSKKREKRRAGIDRPAKVWGGSIGSGVALVSPWSFDERRPTHQTASPIKER